MGESLIMEWKINSDITREEAVKTIEEKILFLQELTEVNDIKKAFTDIYSELKSIFISKEILEKLEIKMIYQENVYSKERNKENIILAKDKVIKYLNRIVISLKSDLNDNDILTENITIYILKKIMNNLDRKSVV